MDSNLTIIWLCNSMCTDFRRCGEIDEEMKQKLNEMYVGRLIHILSHTMKRHNPAEVMENDDLTTMQKHVLKFILLETMHRDVELCKQVLWQMYENRKKSCDSRNDF